MNKYIKLYEQFNIQEIDPYGEEDWNDKHLEILYEKVMKSKEQYIFFKKPILIGEINNGDDLYINYYYRHVNPFYGEDYLVFNVIYNKRPDEKKFNDVLWDSNLINHIDIEIGKIKRMKLIDGNFKEMEINLKVFDNFFEILSEYVDKIDDKWIEKCESKKSHWIGLDYVIEKIKI